MGAGLDQVIALMASDCLEMPHDKNPNTVSIVTEHWSWHMTSRIGTFVSCL